MLYSTINFDVVNANGRLSRAIVVTNGDIDLLTGISGKVNGIVVPVALTVSRIFGGYGPLRQERESQWVIVDCS